MSTPLEYNSQSERLNDYKKRIENRSIDQAAQMQHDFLEKYNKLSALLNKLDDEEFIYNFIKKFNENIKSNEGLKNKLTTILYYILLSPVDVLFRILTYVTTPQYAANFEQNKNKYGELFVKINEIIQTIKIIVKDDLIWLSKKNSHNVPKIVSIVQNTVYLIINYVFEHLDLFDAEFLELKSSIPKDPKDILKLHVNNLLEYFENINNPDNELKTVLIIMRSLMFLSIIY